MDKFDLKGLTPIPVPVKLTGSGATIDVITHDFKQCLYLLLNDESLMIDENLLWNGSSSLFEFPSTSKSGVLGDINTGSVYKSAYKTYIQDPTKEILCPIIFLHLL